MVSPPSLGTWGQGCRNAGLFGWGCVQFRAVSPRGLVLSRGLLERYQDGAMGGRLTSRILPASDPGVCLWVAIRKNHFSSYPKQLRHSRHLLPVPVFVCSLMCVRPSHSRRFLQLADLLTLRGDVFGGKT